MEKEILVFGNGIVCNTFENCDKGVKIEITQHGKKGVYNVREFINNTLIDERLYDSEILLSLKIRDILE